MSTALEICAEAFRIAQHDQALTSFSTTQNFPYNNALSLIRTVVREMNRWGNYRAMYTINSLSYSAGVYQYDLSSQSPAIEPHRIVRVYRNLSDYQKELDPYQWVMFWRKYRRGAVQTTAPHAWTFYEDRLELDAIPDQDYEIKVEHYRGIPLPDETTDTFDDWPEEDEDVFIAGVYAHLLQLMGRPDFQEAYQLYRAKASDLLADEKQVRSMPTQMPSNF